MSTKRKAATKLAMPVSRPAKKTTKFSIDESRTAITAVDSVPSTKPTETIEISSDSSESEYDVSNAEDDDDDDEEEEEEEDAEASKQSQPTNPDAKDESLIPNGTSHHHEDEEMHDATAKDDSEGEEKEEEDDDADAAPTFGDLVRANEPIDVPSGLAPQSTLTHHSGRAIATPSLSSLGTVLTQALRTDDSDLLESCFAVGDITTVRNTIQRLDSGLAGLLLTKLAARLHRRPGRAGTLMGWVQWTLVAHGGALAAQPDLVKKLTDLNRVLEERARGLGSLLALKGKLDMLESQMNLRRATRKLQLGNEEDEEDEDDRVVYVAGDNTHDTDNEVDVDDDDALVMVNGVGEESDSGDEEEESDEANEEEQSAGEEEVYEDEVVHDDVDSEEEEDSDFAEAVAPPAKMQKTSAGFSKRR